MRTTLLTTALATLLAAQAGCATLFSGDQDTVRVASGSPGATITVDGAPYGTTPAAIPLDKTKNHTIVITNAAGQQFTCQINATVGAGWVVLDILGGLVPVIIDAATGKWKSLDTDLCQAPV